MYLSKARLTLTKTATSIVLLALSSVTLGQTITLGNLVTFSSEESNYTLEKASVTAFSSTSGWSLSRRKCHKSKTRTGQGFPYRYNYQAIEASAQAKVAISEKEIEVSGLVEAIESAKKSLSQKVPFYCGKEHGMALELTVKRESGDTVKSYISLGLDDGRLYAEKPYGRVYLDNSDLDFIPTIGR